MFIGHKAAAAENADNKALNIRYSCFPRKDIRAVDYKSYLEKSLEQQTKKTTEKEQKSSKQKKDLFKDDKIKQEFDSYKKRQLDAIKSDKETLENLHKAIQTLNAEEELEYIAPLQNIDKLEGKTPN